MAVLSCIDDFFTVGKPGTDECQLNLLTALGYQWTSVNSILFLSTELDSVALKIHLPGDKLANLRALLKSMQKEGDAALIGSLLHACKAVNSG